MKHIAIAACLLLSGCNWGEQTTFMVESLDCNGGKGSDESYYKKRDDAVAQAKLKFVTCKIVAIIKIYSSSDTVWGSQELLWAKSEKDE